MFDQLLQLCRQYGILATAETAIEAQKVAENNDTDWEGYNHADCCKDVSDADFVNLAEWDDGPRNGHLQDTAAAGRSDQDSKQHRQQASKQDAKQDSEQAGTHDSKQQSKQPDKQHMREQRATKRGNR